MALSRENILSIAFPNGKLCPKYQLRVRRWFADRLRIAFPADSDRELARKAARVLDVSERQVMNWLQLKHDVGLSSMTFVMMMSGDENLLELP